MKITLSIEKLITEIILLPRGQAIFQTDLYLCQERNAV